MHLGRGIRENGYDEYDYEDIAAEFEPRARRLPAAAADEYGYEDDEYGYDAYGYEDDAADEVVKLSGSASAQHGRERVYSETRCLLSN